MRGARNAAMAAGLLVLGACGGADDEASSAATEPATAPASDAATTLAPTTGAADTTSPTTDAATTDGTTGTTARGTDAAPDETSGVAATTAAAPDEPWEDPTGTFRVAFPIEPRPQESQAQVGDGTTIPVTAYLAEVAGAAAVAACVESGSDLSDVDANLASARDGSLAQFGAELVSDARSDLQGRPGIEFRGAIGEAGAVSGRAYLDDVRVCSLLVIGEPNVVADVAGPFLDSFEFVKEAA